MQLASFGPLVIFFFFRVLFILIIIFRQGWGGLGEVATTKIALKTGSEFLHVFCSFCTMFYVYVLLFPSIDIYIYIYIYIHK